jgi:hypothetical protein
MERAIQARCSANALPERKLAMHTVTTDRVIARNDNVVWWISTENLNHQRPGFPGAGGLRKVSQQMCEVRLAARDIGMSRAC